MGKGRRKQKRHIRRGEGFTRDHIGIHRNHFNPSSPGAFRKAESFLEKNTEQATLAFGMVQPTVKKLLNSWGDIASKSILV